jgi:putative ABC transport system permease protein
MNTLWNDLRFAARMLARKPGFAAVAVLTLALGIGANTAIFSVVNAILLRPLPYDHPRALVQISDTYFPQFPKIGISGADLADFRRETRSFTEMGAYRDVPSGLNLTGDGDPERIQATNASSDLFTMLGVKPPAGRTFSAAEDAPGTAPVALLSHRLWQSRYGANPAVVGKIITLDGKGYTVAGVLPAGFELPRWADVWLPVGLDTDELTSRKYHPFDVIARLKTGVSVAQAQAEMETMERRLAASYPQTDKNFGVLVAPLQDPLAAALRPALLVLFGVVGLVLLIACANTVNLLLGRNAARQKEIALRIALGAGRRRLLRQLLTESLLLALLGGGLGIALAQSALSLMQAALPENLSGLSGAGLDSAVLSFTMAITLLTGILSGLLPALQTLRSHLNEILKDAGRNPAAGGVGGRRLRGALVISEIALALVPLIAAGLLMKSFRKLLAVDPGFHPERVLTVQISVPQTSTSEYLRMTPEQQLALAKKQLFQFERIAARIRALPGVQAAGGIDALPLAAESRQRTRFVVEGQPETETGLRPVAEFRTPSVEYFDVMGIPLLKGRLLTEVDWTGFNIVVNETLARRFWSNGEALGKRINTCSLDPQPCWSTIVGVVGNVHQFGLDAPPTMDVYATGGWTNFLVIRTAADPLPLAAAVRKEIRTAEPALPVSHIATLDELLADSVAQRRFSAVLVGVFAGLALLLAAAGVYSVMAYSVEQRTQEIGIRVALGAQRADVLRLILGQGLRLIAGGVALGLFGAAAAARGLSSLLYGVSAADPLIFGGVALLLVAIALLACYVPALRSMRVDPIVALRHE